jgi:hypothetical protein
MKRPPRKGREFAAIGDTQKPPATAMRDRLAGFVEAHNDGSPLGRFFVGHRLPCTSSGRLGWRRPRRPPDGARNEPPGQ